MADLYDRHIVECAKRLAAKLTEGEYYTLNGEFSRPVQQEIRRMKVLCAKSEKMMNQCESRYNGGRVIIDGQWRDLLWRAHAYLQREYKKGYRYVVVKEIKT